MIMFRAFTDVNFYVLVIRSISNHQMFACYCRLAFDEDRVPDLTSEEYLQDVHSISSLLKMYFRELPNPLLTYQLYDKFAVSWLRVVSGPVLLFNKIC